jgi:hypothetical protein
LRLIVRWFDLQGCVADVPACDSPFAESRKVRRHGSRSKNAQNFASLNPLSRHSYSVQIKKEPSHSSRFSKVDGCYDRNLIVSSTISDVGL